MADVFSCYAWAVPTRDRTAATTIKSLQQHVIQPLGWDECIHSDWGARCTQHHTGHKAVERFNHTVQSLLSSRDKEKQIHWAHKLPELTHAFNNTVTVSPGRSPFYGMFGRHARDGQGQWVLLGQPIELGGVLLRWDWFVMLLFRRLHLSECRTLLMHVFYMLPFARVLQRVSGCYNLTMRFVFPTQVSLHTAECAAVRSLWLDHSISDW